MVAKASWELGTAAETLLELSWPSLSVFSSSAFPPPSHLNATATPSDVLEIAKNTVSAKPVDSPLPLTEHSPEGQAFVLLLQAAWNSCNLFIASPQGA
ncbi:hypothetical protein HYPSUDRAFT_476772 [Hypholoma sublateritium FD-334 SS-4]|uniref:Uncharacterized protein n=1 Tax=Hypholoma sublateritium (strain FD-334 SS-4) TaxID=945553 RepID=A0A0D2P7D7_HYPSF|nr:hypothetical protein HYPSUDRAFT_476772 [Hypholoma sublateritium FD-334 SS-4]